MRQLSFIKSPPPIHGGELGLGKRKMMRPLSTKRPLHLVLKARSRVLYKHKVHIEREIRRLGDKFQLRVYGVAVNFDHLHLMLKIPHRRNYVLFIRALTGVLARKLGKGLWKLLPFSRVLTWGRDFQRNLDYLHKNRREASGAISYEPRKDWYQRYRCKEASG